MWKEVVLHVGLNTKWLVAHQDVSIVEAVQNIWTQEGILPLITVCVQYVWEGDKQPFVHVQQQPLSFHTACSLLDVRNAHASLQNPVELWLVEQLWMSGLVWLQLDCHLLLKIGNYNTWDYQWTRLWTALKPIDSCPTFTIQYTGCCSDNIRGCAGVTCIYGTVNKAGLAHCYMYIQVLTEYDVMVLYHLNLHVHGMYGLLSNLYVSS